MRYINQREYPHIPYITRTNPEHTEHEKGKTTTVFTSGCGLCSAIMVADRLLTEYSFDLEDALALSYETGANHSAGTDYKIFAPAFAERMGLRLAFSKDIQDLRNCLRTGGAAVILFSGDRENHVGLFTHRGHYVAAISEEADGRIVILDPNDYAGKFEEEGRQGKVEIKQSPFILCSTDIIEEETLPTRIPYWLFWRA